MPIHPELHRSLMEKFARDDQPVAPLGEPQRGPQVRFGDAIFGDGDYPRTWDRFIGQTQAVEHLRAHIASVERRGADRLDHILLASGLHGIGKTTLAMLVAAHARTLDTIIGSTPGFVQISGPLTVDEGRDVIADLQDGDIVFWDEFHLAVSGGRNRADWLLPFLTDHVLLTQAGAEPMPNVTVIAATTELGKLPQAVISRFMVKPRLVGYTDDEGAVLAGNLADRMRVDLPGNARRDVARAANNNPRDMRTVLSAVRDLPDSFDLDLALSWAGFTRDGLSTVAVEMLLVLLAAADHTASIETIQAQLNEPGTLRHHEQTLLQRGFLSITSRGRVLTDAGIARAVREVAFR